MRRLQQVHGNKSAQRALQRVALLGGRPTTTMTTDRNQLLPDLQRQQGGGGQSGGHVHDRPTFEEQHVGFARYRAEDGWIYIEGPSGAGGHALTAPGLDGVAYNVRSGGLEIVEQKGISRARRVGLGDRPTAVTTNLSRNLDGVIARVSAMPDLPHQERILALLQQTRAALEGNTTVPANVRIVITSERGTGITRGLRTYWSSRGVQLPVEFEGTGVTGTRTPRAGSGEPRPAAGQGQQELEAGGATRALGIAAVALSAATFALQVAPAGGGGFHLTNAQVRYSRQQAGPHPVTEGEFAILNLGSIKGLGASYAFLKLVLRYDGNNILSAYTRQDVVSGYEGGTLGSEAAVNFSAVESSGPSEAVAQVYLLFEGYNNPSGPGFQRFSGRILVTGDGRVEPRGVRLTSGGGHARNWLSGFDIGWD